MPNAFCSTEWHEGARVPATYAVRAIVLTSGRFDHPQTWADYDRAVPSMFVCCDVHLHSAVALMVGSHGDVRVRAIESEEL